MNVVFSDGLILVCLCQQIIRCIVNVIRGDSPPDSFDPVTCTIVFKGISVEAFDLMARIKTVARSLSGLAARHKR